MSDTLDLYLHGQTVAAQHKLIKDLNLRNKLRGYTKLSRADLTAALRPLIKTYNDDGVMRIGAVDTKYVDMTAPTPKVRVKKVVSTESESTPAETLAETQPIKPVKKQPKKSKQAEQDTNIDNVPSNTAAAAANHPVVSLDEIAKSVVDVKAKVAAIEKKPAKKASVKKTVEIASLPTLVIA